MAQNLYGIPVQLVASAAVTADGNSGNLKNTSASIPPSVSAAFYLDVTAASGTSETLDVYIETSVDGGTTWFEAFHFAQVTTSTMTRRLNVRTDGLGPAEAGTEAQVDVTGSTAVAASTPLTPDVRVRWDLGGTDPGYTFAVWGIFMPLGGLF